MAATTEASISDNFDKYLMSLKAPVTFKEIENECKYFNIGDELPEMLEHAESSGKISSKTLSSAGSQLKVYYNTVPAPSAPLTTTPVRSTVSLTRPHTAPPLYSFPQSHSRRRVNLPFRSPAVVKQTSSSTTTPVKCVQAETNSSLTNSEPSSAASKSVTVENISTLPISALEERFSKLNEDIALLLKEHDESELDLHVKALHEYNEIKDVGQVLLGKLAESLGMTTSDMYDRFSLNLQD